MDPTTEEKRSGIARLVSLFSNQSGPIAGGPAAQSQPGLARSCARARASPRQCPQFLSVRHA